MSTESASIDVRQVAGQPGKRRSVLAWRWLTGAFMVLILSQAVFASVGLFESEPTLVDIHRELGNLLPLLALVQAGLAMFLARRRAVGRAALWVSMALVPLVTGQLMMGYETTGNSTAIAWHIPLGVLLMSLTTANAVLAWNPRHPER